MIRTTSFQNCNPYKHVLRISAIVKKDLHIQRAMQHILIGNEVVSSHHSCCLNSFRQIHFGDVIHSK